MDTFVNNNQTDEAADVSSDGQEETITPILAEETAADVASSVQGIYDQLLAIDEAELLPFGPATPDACNT